MAEALRFWPESKLRALPETTFMLTVCALILPLSLYKGLAVQHSDIFICLISPRGTEI